MCYYTPITYSCGHRPEDERTDCEYMKQQLAARARGEDAWECQTATPCAPKAHNLRCEACHTAWLNVQHGHWVIKWAGMRDILRADGGFDPLEVEQAIASVRVTYQATYDRVLGVEVEMTRAGHSDVYEKFTGWIVEWTGEALDTVRDKLWGEE